MITELIILRGLPGCGKSTWARNWVAEDPAHRAEVNRDHLRQMMHDGVYLGYDTELQVVAARDAMIETLLNLGVSVVCSDTNLPRRTVRDLAKLAVRTKVRWRVRDMTDVPLEDCLARNQVRLDKDPVPEEVILDYYTRYITPLKGKPLPLPEEQDVQHDAGVYIPDPSLPPAIIVDIDGTVALKGTRDPFDEARVHEDRPNEPVIDIVRRMWASYLVQGKDIKIIFLSGRTDACEAATRDWLGSHVGIPHELHMRKAGDMRKDWIIKQELFDEYIRGKYNVLFVLDDRQQVVDFWRRLGLTCLQVAEGNF